MLGGLIKAYAKELMRSAAVPTAEARIFTELAAAKAGHHKAALAAFRGILQYVPQFREKTFVVAMDGAAVADENFANILKDVAVLWSLNIRVVLVHGASVLIRALARDAGVTPSDLEGSGVTDAETLKLALTASNRLTHDTLEGLAAADLRAATTISDDDLKPKSRMWDFTMP